jgi:hypothetical protein
MTQTLNTMAVLNPRIRHTMIDGALFEQEVASLNIRSVPTVFLNGQFFSNGRMSVEEIIQKVDTGAAKRDAAKLSAKAPYEVLIVGGGPAGAAAAIYAARKGIRTGVVAERFGGQVNDTMEIANYPGVPETNGPAYAAQLEAHVRNYEVDIMNTQRVAEAGARGGNGWPHHGEARQRRHAAKPHRHPRHRRALAQRQRAGRAGIQDQGRGVLPALRRPAVQGQGRGGHRRRQLRRRSRH